MATNNAANTTSGGNFLGRNRVVNGDFQIWQRGAGGSASFAQAASATVFYYADRWQFTNSNGAATTVAQTAGATSGSYLARVQRNAAETSTNPIILCTSLTRDMCIGMAGNAVTLSFKARAGADFSAASSAITIAIYSGTGTADTSGIGGAFTGSSLVSNPTQVITTTLANYSVTTAALGATVTQLAVQFYFAGVGAAGAADYFDITDVQVEVSNQQTPFERKNFAQQYADCLPFYCKSFLYSTAPAQNVGAATNEHYFNATVAGASTMFSGSIYWPTRMRAAPTVTTFNPAAANAEVRDETAVADCSAVGTVSREKAMLLNCNGNAGTAVGNVLGVHFTADADVV